MNVTLLSYTQLDMAALADSPIARGAGTMQENLIEYAGRVCYRSDAKMGYNPKFIHARVREGHEDIIEHVRFIFRAEGVALDETVLALVHLPTVEYTNLGEGRWIFSMNARNVRDFWRNSRSQLAEAMIRLANQVLPSVYFDLEPVQEVTK
ncbi:MAG: FAD-dependent thymidylate synthase [Chloroflexi bacterium]|nr:FAD-dependent thymidylate synthase [Chloroflexota bacterium]